MHLRIISLIVELTYKGNLWLHYYLIMEIDASLKMTAPRLVAVVGLVKRICFSYELSNFSDMKWKLIFETSLVSEGA